MIKSYLKNIERIAPCLDESTKTDASSCTYMSRFGFDFELFKKDLDESDFTQYQNTDKFKANLKIAFKSPIEPMLFPGSDQAIRAFMDLWNPSTVISMPDYTFPMHKVYAELNNLVIDEVKYDGLELPLTKFYGKDVVVITNPASPIGNSYSVNELLSLANNVKYLLIDEAYIDYSSQESFIPYLSPVDNVIVVSTFSKGLAGAGARIGMLFGSNEMLNVLGKFRFMYEVSGPSIVYGEWILARMQLLTAYQRETIETRDKLFNLLLSRKYDIINTDANWLHLKPKEDTIELLSSIYKLRTGTTLPCGKDYIRLTIGSSSYKVLKDILH